MNIWVGPSGDVQALLIVARPGGPSGIWTWSSGYVVFLWSCVCKGVAWPWGEPWVCLASVTLRVAVAPGPDDWPLWGRSVRASMLGG